MLKVTFRNFFTKKLLNLTPPLTPYRKLAKKNCIQCDPILLVQWNGRCPKCNAELLLKVA